MEAHHGLQSLRAQVREPENKANLESLWERFVCVLLNPVKLPPSEISMAAWSKRECVCAGFLSVPE